MLTFSTVTAPWRNQNAHWYGSTTQTRCVNKVNRAEAKHWIFLPTRSGSYIPCTLSKKQVKEKQSFCTATKIHELVRLKKRHLNHTYTALISCRGHFPHKGAVSSSCLGNIKSHTYKESVWWWREGRHLRSLGPVKIPPVPAEKIALQIV